jgi:hypothetical protein
MAALRGLHRRIASELPSWDGRVEVVYLTEDAIVSSLTGIASAARISPGEPFHRIRIDHRWSIDWYRLRVEGVTLVGPPIGDVVPLISHEAYVERVSEHVMTWPDLQQHASLGEQAYAILSMCRGLRTVRTGEPGSKAEAARWAAGELPHDARLIRQALEWRSRARFETPGEGASALEGTRAFVAEVQTLLEPSTS